MSPKTNTETMSRAVEQLHAILKDLYKEADEQTATVTPGRDYTAFSRAACACALVGAARDLLMMEDAEASEHIFQKMPVLTLQKLGELMGHYEAGFPLEEANA